MVTPEWGKFQRPQTNIPKENIASLQEEEKPQPQQKQWGDFQSPETYQGPIDPTAEENTLGYIMRNVTANASRLFEQTAGRFGNIEKFVKNTLTSFPSSGGILGKALYELVGPERWETIIKGGPGREQNILPTSEDIKLASQTLSKEYTTPKTKGEKRLQNVTEDIGATLSGRIPNFRNLAINNLGIPAAANEVKNIVEDLGFGEEKGNYAKLATWLALTLSGNVNAPRYASDLMNRGRAGIPDTVHIDVPRLQNRLQQVANSPYLLHADPRSALAREELSAIQRDLAQGQTRVRSLMNTYDGINSAKRSRGLFELSRPDREFARTAIDEVRNAVRDEIMDAGAAYPDALNSWRNGIQAWAVVHRSRALTNLIESIAKGPYAKILSGPAAGLFGIGGFAGFKAPNVALPLAGAVPAAYKTIQTGYRVWQDPNLARYYWNALGALVRENTPAFISNYLKLNKGLEKSNSTNVKAKSKKD